MLKRLNRQRCLHMALDSHGIQEGQAGDGRCPLCRTELCAHDVVAAPVPAPALVLVPGGDHWDPTDPSSPRRILSTSPRRELSVDSPRRSGAEEETMVLAADDASQEQRLPQESSRGVGWSTKLQAIVDELDFVNREHPGEKVCYACCCVTAAFCLSCSRAGMHAVDQLSILRNLAAAVLADVSSRIYLVVVVNGMHCNGRW